MILSCQHISKSFNEVPVIKDCTFHIEDHEKAALIGTNGAGKTTLLRIITGESSPDSGTVNLQKNKTFAYLPQTVDFGSDKTILEEMYSTKKDIIDLEEEIKNLQLSMENLSGDALEEAMNRLSTATHQFEIMDGYSYQSEIYGVLKGLGFEKKDHTLKVDTLSGGQKTRVALAKMLLSGSDLLLLDEPTNHLDVGSIAWLEGFLSAYKGAVLIVSHDRFFIDRIANKIIELDGGISGVFTGNYSAYAAKKEIIRNQKLKAYENQQREIAHQEAVIEKLRSFNREKSIKRAESRVKQLDKLQRLDKPTELNTDMHLTLIPNIISGNDVLSVEHLGKAFGDNVLFTDINFSLRRGDHVAIIGENGTGKTTILRILNDQLEASSGSIKLGTNVHIGYFDQEHRVLNYDKTLFDEISDEYPDMNNTQIRNTLAAFLFTGDDVFKRIDTLSGGEQGRLALSKLMLSEANFLILDEPTNHLDIPSKEILEDAINKYEGTLLYVSHDRYFINRTAHRILELNGKVLTEYLGNYDYYLEKRAQLSSDAPFSTQSVSSTQKASSLDGQSIQTDMSSNKADYLARKSQAAARRKLENELKNIEERIQEAEQLAEDLNSEVLKPEISSDHNKLAEIAAKQEENTTLLDELYRRWEELSEELE